MQSRYRNSNDGFRSGSFNRNRYRGGGGGGGFNRNYSKSYNNSTPPASRKYEILMEAGRLAAEYLVSKGVLSPNVLPGNLSNDGGSVPEFRGQGRENSHLLQFGVEGRNSAVARLGGEGSDVGYRKRRFDDDYDVQGSQRNGRGRKRMAYYSRGYGPDWGKERGRNDSWNERSRGYSGGMEDEDDFAPGYHRRERQGGNDDVGSSVSHTAGDEQNSKTEAVGESGSELDDTGSKASSNSMKKDAAPEVDADLSKEMDPDAGLSKEMDVEVNADLSKEMDSEVNADLSKEIDSEVNAVLRKDKDPEVDADLSKVMDETNALNVEAGDVKSGECSDLEKKSTPGEEDYRSISDGNGDEFVNENPSDTLKLCDFLKVPRRRRSLVVHKGSLPDRSLCDEEAKKVEDAMGEESKVAAVTAPLKESPTAYDNGSDCKVPASSGSAVNNSSKETLDPQCELVENLQHVELSGLAVDEVNKAADQKEPEREINAFLAKTSQENDLSQPGSAGLKETGMVNEILHQDAGRTEISSGKEIPSQDVEMMEAAEQLKPLLVSKLEANLYARTQWKNHKLSASFKTCDLNLMEAPEITEIPDDTEDPHISSAPLETGDQLPEDFGQSASNSKAKNTYEYNNSSADEKVIQVIDLEDDCPSEMNASYESTKPKNELVYTGIENVLNQEPHADDLQVMQENFGLGISDYLGADMTCSPSVQADLNNLQSGMGLPGPEGYAVGDDSIYGALSDIGFMEVWDQPAHEYEKFF